MIAIIICCVIIALILIYILIGFILRYFVSSNKALTKIKNREGEINNDFAIQEDADWFEHNTNENLYIKSFDKKELKGYLFRSKNKSHLYMIYAHGWLGRPVEKTAILRRFYEDLDINILIIEQRGQNSSQIKYISWGSSEGKDIISWCKYIEKLDSKASIILYGQSMGAASIMYSMSFGNTKSTIGIIEDCGYLSIKKQFISTASPYTGKLIANLFTPSLCFALWITGTSFFKNNPLIGIKKNIIPFLAIHGTADELVPFSNFETINKEVNNKCIFKSKQFNNAKHACSCVVDLESYISLVENFIKSIY